MPLDAPVTIAPLLDSLLIFTIVLDPTSRNRTSVAVNCASRMKVSIHAPYAKERLETACQHSILHPEGVVGNAEVIPRNVGEQRASPPQSNSLAAAASGSAVRCMKMLLRQTVAQEDHDAMRK